MKEDCIFCQIIGGEERADSAYRGDTVVAFKDAQADGTGKVIF